MKKVTRKALAIFLSVLMVTCGLPFMAFAEDPCTLTISANTTSSDIDIDDDVAFSYEVLINGVPYNGTAADAEGNEYAVVDGIVTIPYNTAATVSGLAIGAAYAVKRLAYDNEKYALLDDSEVISGKVGESRYFRELNGEEVEIAENDFVTETANGTNLEFRVVKDNEGNVYSEDEVGRRGGYTDKSDTTNGDYVYALASEENYVITAAVSYSAITKQGSGFKTTYKASATYTFDCNYEGIDAESGSVDKSMPMTSAGLSAQVEVDLLSKFNEYADYCFNVIKEANEDSKYVVLDSQAASVLNYVTFKFSEKGTQNASVGVSAFKLTENIFNYKYRVEIGEQDKTATFDVNLTPAPTGTFQLNFALDDAVPAGYEDAVFEIKDAEGNVLTEGVDYTLEKSPYSLEYITKGILKWGITIYSFSGLKAGAYTFKQVATQNGYKIDTNEYSFVVARRDGKVSGVNCDTSAINSSTPCIWNSDKSIKVIVTIKLYLFMNESFTLSFNVKDQKNEPVEGAQFMMIERDALISLVRDLAELGINNIGDLNIQDIISSIGGLDFSNMDMGTILEILKTILQIVPTLPEGKKLTVPAILMASSNEDGVVKFNNSSNILNVLGTIADIMAGIDGEVDAEKVAETIKNLVGSAVPEEYLDTLVALAGYINSLDVHTGIPPAYYALFQTAAPDGYERNATMYTIKVGTDGNATTSAGVLIPVIADAVKERFDIDIYDILINEEEFNNASAELKKGFADFSDYANMIVDAVVAVIGDNTILGVGAEQLEQLKETLNNAYEGYDDFSADIGEALKDFNSKIKDDFTEDWTYTNNRYFLNVAVTSEDCDGNAIEFTVTDANGEAWDIAGGVAILPYGTYTFAPAAELEENYALKDGSSAFELVIDDHNATYAVSYIYHVSVVTGAYDPDCTNTGYTGTIVCQYCSEELEQGSVIAANGHTEETLEAVEPTCTETGLTEGKRCTVCGVTTVEQEVIDANGHTEVAIGEVITPTCTENGLTAGKKCSVCGEILEAQEVVDNLAHYELGLVWESFVAPTCTEPGHDFDIVCMICDELIMEGEELPPNGHSLVIVPAVAPTCTETGLTEGAYCEECDFVVEQEVIDATGHSFGEWVVTTAPQIGVEGEATRYCANCDATETKVLDALVVISFCNINCSIADAREVIDINAMLKHEDEGLRARLAAVEDYLAELEEAGILTRCEHGYIVDTTVTEGSDEEATLTSLVDELNTYKSNIYDNILYKIAMFFVKLLRFVAKLTGGKSIETIIRCGHM